MSKKVTAVFKIKLASADTIDSFDPKIEKPEKLLKMSRSASNYNISELIPVLGLDNDLNLTGHKYEDSCIKCVDRRQDFSVIANQ